MGPKLETDLMKPTIFLLGLAIASTIVLLNGRSAGVPIAFRPEMVMAKPTGYFVTIADPLKPSSWAVIGNNGWSRTFSMTTAGVTSQKVFCESLPWHKGMLLDTLVVEPWVDDAGKIVCWSIRDDRAGFHYQEDKNGYPIHVDPSQAGAATTAAAAKATQAVAPK